MEGTVVYILRCADGTFYTGWTNHFARRLAAHNAGRGAKYTRSRRPVSAVYVEPVADARAARQREYAIKQMTRRDKLSLIEKTNGGIANMATIPTLQQARQLLEQYNKEPFHLRHAQIVSGVLRWFAKEHDPENEEFWAVVGLLHDLDFEQYPQEHCVKTAELMRAHDLDESIIRAAVSHGYGLCQQDTPPQLYMEKVLFAVDELTGLIGAVAVMRPSKSVSDLELKSVMKKFKTPAFAAGCDRAVITRGAELLEITVEELIERTILAMRSLMGEMEI